MNGKGGVYSPEKRSDCQVETALHKPGIERVYGLGANGSGLFNRGVQIAIGNSSAGAVCDVQESMPFSAMQSGCGSARDDSSSDLGSSPRQFSFIGRRLVGVGSSSKDEGRCGRLVFSFRKDYFFVYFRQSLNCKDPTKSCVRGWTPEGIATDYRCRREGVYLQKEKDLGNDNSFLLLFVLSIFNGI